MRRRARFFIATLTLFIGAPGAAQEVRSGAEPAPIVVEGQRDRDLQIRDFVGALPPAPVDGTISRFEHEACPAVLGIAPAQSLMVAARMRVVGAAAGVPMARRDCRPNVVVVVTPDKRQYIEQLARRFPSNFRGLSRRQIARLARSPGPTAWWHRSGIVDADGQQYSAGPQGERISVAASDASPRIRAMTHLEFVGSILVVEAGALHGLTAYELADYAAMRTFTGVDPARLPDRRLSTILTLLDAPEDSQVPITLTGWDLALLRSIYASDAGTYASNQRNEIRTGMRRALEQAANGRDRQ